MVGQVDQTNSEAIVGGHTDFRADRQTNARQRISRGAFFRCVDGAHGYCCMVHGQRGLEDLQTDLDMLCRLERICASISVIHFSTGPSMSTALRKSKVSPCMHARVGRNEVYGAMCIIREAIKDSQSRVLACTHLQ
jgi:hypothetical protein